MLPYISMREIRVTLAFVLWTFLVAGCSSPGGGPSGFMEDGWTPRRNSLDRRIIGFLRGGDYADAVAFIDSVSAGSDPDSRLAAQKGYALGMMGRGEEAVSLFEKAILADYENCWYHHSFAVVLMKMDRVGRALTEFREAKRFCKGRELTEVNRDLAVACIKLGKEEEALREVAEGLETAPSDKHLMGLQALLAVREDPSSEEDLLNYLLEIEGLDPKLCEMIGDALLEGGMPGKAADFFYKSMKTAEDDGEIAFKLGLALKRAGRFKEAEEFLVAKAGDDSAPRLRKILGDVLFQEKDFEGALNIYFSLPQSAEVLDRIAMCYMRLGDSDRALQYEKMALDKRPGWVTALINISVIYGGRGQLEEALRALEKVLELEPDNVTAAENIRRIRAAMDSESVKKGESK